ncbi:DUF3290 family protein [Fructilactobacillus vespulae]|uniref:DUF3290 family protein n=1 Tax=Fructilactobacillus vespulae TaxID=1249630 RepID=UPI0039B64776
MNLYSYEYITHSFGITNNLYWTLVFVSVIIISLIAALYYKQRDNPRLRSFLIVISLIGALFVTLQFDTAMQQKNSTSSSSQVAAIMKNVAKTEHVDIKQVYSSSTSLANGMVIQAGKKTYTVNLNNNQSSYSLNPTNMIGDVNHVDKNELSLNPFSGSSSVGNYETIALKLIVGLITLVIQINLSGKGNLAPTNAVDQLQNYILGGIIGGTIYSPQVTILQYIIILLIWSIIVFTIKFLTTQSTKFSNLINGSPQPLITNGNVDVKRCLKNGITASELAFKLRVNGTNNVNEVKSAVLEQNGQLTITSYSDETITYPLITDGKLNESTLDRITLSEQELDDLLKKEHTTIDNVYLAQYNDNQLKVVKYPAKLRLKHLL